MKKVFLSLIVISLISSSALSQNKIGYINSQELINIMPEAIKAQKDLIELQTALNLEGKEYLAELKSKDSAFVADSSKLSPTSKSLKLNSLNELYRVVQNWDASTKNKLKETQESLLQPISKKIIETLKLVAKENNYIYILEKSSVIVGPPGDDVLQIVKKKLGIK